MTKAQLVQALADRAGLGRREVEAVLENLAGLVAEELKAGRPASIPGVAKVVVRPRPPRPARDGINPFTREPQRFPAKPASRAVRLRPVKALKDQVA